MPVVDRVNGFVFYFFSEEGGEPPHIHVRKAEGRAKYWLTPVRKSWSTGFTRPQERAIREIVQEKKDAFIKEYEEHHH